jgi:hypothetical protein
MFVCVFLWGGGEKQNIKQLFFVLGPPHRKTQKNKNLAKPFRLLQTPFAIIRALLQYHSMIITRLIQ